jgi:hypothetical protein
MSAADISPFRSRTLIKRLPQRPAEYRTWISMRRRCRDKNHKSYRHYGGRGIEVCARWSSFESFIKDMGPRPSDKHTIDRIDNDKGYFPGNCRWATQKQQVRNRRQNRQFCFQGVPMNFSEVAKAIGISRRTLHNRLTRMSVAEALAMPKKGSGKRGKARRFILDRSGK